MGIEEEALKRIYSPVGLYLNAETPEEIAVSIMAEITLLRNQGGAGPVRHRRDPENGDKQ
jgi:xanthine dehydrogenase accessory factor